MRDVTKANMESNKVLESQKHDKECKLQQDELHQDRQELNVATETRQQYVSASDMTKYNQKW